MEPRRRRVLGTNMQHHELARRARAAMPDCVREVLRAADEKFRAAGLAQLDEDEISRLYLAIAEGRDPQKAVNDITRDRRWDPSTRSSYAAIVSLSEELDSGDSENLHSEDMACDELGVGASMPDPASEDDTPRQLVRVLLSISATLSLQELQAAADELNNAGAWRSRIASDGRPVGRRFATSDFRVRAQRAGLAAAVDALAPIVQSRDAQGLQKTAQAVLREARALNEHYCDVFAAELECLFTEVDELLEDAVAQVRGPEACDQEAEAEAETKGLRGWEEGRELEAVLSAACWPESAHFDQARPRERAWRRSFRRPRLPARRPRQIPPRNSVRRAEKEASPSVEPGPAVLDILGTNPIASSNLRQFFDREKECSVILRWAG